MQVGLLAPLIELRWRLFWAKARTQSGRAGVAFGLLVAALVAVALGLAGMRVGAVGARLGKTVLVADAAFAALFLLALFVALSTGLESTPTFSDESLRRYPLTRFERLTARNAVGLFDLLWLFALALDLGVAAGFAAIGLLLGGLPCRLPSCFSWRTIWQRGWWGRRSTA